jgi:dodecin
MSEADHVYKLIELTGTSSKGIEDAVNNALARAAKTVRNMRWFEVTETRGKIDAGRASLWQVRVKVGFWL